MDAWDGGARAMGLARGLACTDVKTRQLREIAEEGQTGQLR